MLPPYPHITLNCVSYQYQSIRQDPSNTSVCKPIAVISHDNSLSLVTCLQTNRVQNNTFICQHQEQLSNVNSIPRTSLIQDLQRKSYRVYTLNPDGSSVQEPLVECEASRSPLAELKLEDLTEFMEIDEASFNQSAQSDLDSHQVNEEAMQKLLSPEVTANELSFSQQGASTSAQTALLNFPTNNLVLSQKIIHYLSTLIPSNRQKIYCLLEVLENHKEQLFTKKELINKMKAKYINFDVIQSYGTFNHAFTHAITLDLIQKSGHHSDMSGIVYAIKKEGLLVLEFLKQEVLPTLKQRSPAATHPINDQ